MAELVTEPITEADVDAEFGCGEPALDAYFREHAFPNSERGIGKCFVLRRPPGQPDLPPVLGFYTLSMASLERGALPPKLQKKVPRYPMPVALLGRLAVDARAQGLGLGGLLLEDALERILLLARDIGCFGVIVDAKNENAETFYGKYGFKAIAGPKAPYPSRSFLPMKALRESKGTGPAGVPDER